MIEIELTQQEHYLAFVVGVRRRLSATGNGHREVHGLGRESAAKKIYYNLVGAAGEMAAAKALGLYWPAMITQDKGDADIPPDWQVRSMAKDDYDLLVRPDDADHFKYLLVTGEPPRMKVIGWILGRDAKRAEWLSDKGERNTPAYWVPQTALNQVYSDE